MGEYVASQGYAISLGLGGYTDWRLLPRSPLIDKGFAPALGDPIEMENGTTFTELHRAIGPLVWDGEYRGNPRIVGDKPDVGFDEVHMFTMAGSWANDSNSHDRTPTDLNPDAPNAQDTRIMILPETIVTTTHGTFDLDSGAYELKVHGVARAPASVPPPAWTVPPPALVNSVDNPSLPEGYRTKYMTFSNPGSVPTPWAVSQITTATTVNNYAPIGMATTPQGLTFIDIHSFVDSGDTSGGEYFAMQPVIRELSSAVLRGNMQAEYR